MNNLEIVVYQVLLAYSKGDEVDTSDPLVSRVKSKLIRRGMLNKSVVSGEVTLSSYGAKMLRKIEAKEEFYE